MDENGYIYLSDFGSAKFLKDDKVNFFYIYRLLKHFVVQRNI